MHALHDVLDKFFNPHSFRLAVPDIWAGFQVNLKMMVIAEAFVLVLALAVAVIRGLPGRAAMPLRALAVVYTDFFRGTPLIIVGFIIGVGLPGLQLAWISSFSPVTYGIIALTHEPIDPTQSQKCDGQRINSIRIGVRIKNDEFARDREQSDQHDRFHLHDVVASKHHANDGVLELHRDQQRHDHAEDRLEHSVIQWVQRFQHQ